MDLDTFIAGKTEDVLEGLQPHENLKSLHISGYSGANLPTWLASNVSVKMLRILHIEKCREWQILRLQMLPFLRLSAPSTAKQPCSTRWRTVRSHRAPASGSTARARSCPPLLPVYRPHSTLNTVAGGERVGEREKGEGRGIKYEIIDIE